jgi:hypothetical protein
MKRVIISLLLQKKILSNLLIIRQKADKVCFLLSCWYGTLLFDEKISLFLVQHKPFSAPKTPNGPKNKKRTILAFFGDRFGGKEGGCAHTTVAEEVG